MAYASNDDRFYDALTGAGKDYQKYRDRVAEDQAATTRELGQTYGQALPNTVNAVMKGADWSMKRAADEQKMDLATSEEGRAQAEEGRKGTKFGWEGEDRATQLAAAAKATAYDMAPATEEETSMAGLNYHPGMTHADLKQAAGIQSLGKDMRDLDFKKTEEGGRNSRSSAQITSEEARAAATLAGENARAAASQYGENTRQDKSLANQRELEGMRLAQKPPKVPPPETLNKLSDADSAQKSLDLLADEWRGKASGKFAGASQYMPGTDAAKYNDALGVHATNVATFLKAGRGSPTPADIENAKALLPTAGDSPERAQDKLERMSALIAERKRAHAHELETAGFQIGDIQADGQGAQYDLKHKTPKTGTAYGGNDMNLAPADLQAAMVNKANGGNHHVPLHKMTLEEKKAEARARGIPVD